MCQRQLLCALFLVAASLNRVNARLAATRPRTVDLEDPRIGRSLLRRLQQERDELMHVFIGYKNNLKPDLDTISAHSVKSSPGLKRVNAVGAWVSKDQLESILSNPNVEYVEEDAMVYPVWARSRRLRDLPETYPYGITLTQGDSPDIDQSSPGSASSLTNACNQESSFKVAIVDSGLDWDHPDSPCRSLSDQDTNCIGKSFDLHEDARWYDPESPHGTHVFGTIAGSRTNNEGISGMLTDNDNVCFVICQIFEKQESSLTSTVIDAVDWAIQQGAKVINLSLSGSGYSKTEEKFFEQVRLNGVLVIAAVGNDGNDKVSYPAGYDAVVAVGAVDADLSLATFSQYNKQVDIVAPGEGILSSVSVGTGGLVSLLLDDGEEITGTVMQFSSLPSSDGLSGELVVCSDFGAVPCEGAGNHVCLIERGITTFEDKALSCEASGGIAAIIYNNVGGVVAGMLLEKTKTTIPVLGVSKVEGAILASLYNGKVVSITVDTNYAYMSGTSMAAPHVAGAASEIWRTCTGCSNIEVEDCLLKTALDLGPTGKDVSFGAGLLQTRDAYHCLVNTAGCCDPETPSGTSNDR